MIVTSSAYKTNIKADERKTRPLLICEFNRDIAQYPVGTATATSAHVTNTANKAINGRIRETTDTGQVTTAGTYIDNLLTAHAGWWSTNLSDINGVFASAEVLTITYPNKIACKNFFIIGNSTNYPVNFTIELSNDGATWETLVTVTNNDSDIYVYNSTTDKNFIYFRLSITKISVISSPVKVIQAGAVTTIVLDYQDVEEFDILEELITQGESPLGLVSSNSFEFTLSNENKFFSEDNSDSPFYRIIKNEVKLYPFLGIEITSGLFEWVPCGVYYGRYSSKDSTDVFVKFMGWDEIFKIKDLPTPIYPVKTDTTIYNLWVDLFTELGYSSTDYSVSTRLNQPVKHGFFAGDVGSNFANETVGEVMQVLSEAGNCYCFCDHYGKFVVHSNFKAGASVFTLTDTDMVFSSKNIKESSTAYESIKIRYRESVGELVETLIYEANDIEIIGGVSNLDLEFPDPILKINRVALLGAVNATVTSFDQGAVRTKIYFSNSVSSEIVNIKIYGFKLFVYNTSYETSNYSDPSSTLKISNWLIQDKNTAMQYAHALKQYCSTNNNLYEIIERGDMSAEIGDLINLDDNTTGIDETLQIIRKNMVWKGFLQNTMTARRRMLYYSWCCPGLVYLWVPITAE